MSDHFPVDRISDESIVHLLQPFVEQAIAENPGASDADIAEAAMRLIDPASILAGRLHEGLSISAKLAGELVPAIGTSITNVILHPDYQRLRTELIRALMPYPEAREAVAAVFRHAGEAAADSMRRSGPRMIEGRAVEVSDAA